jgi:hypothetical protein
MLEDGASRHSVLGTILERIYRDVVSSFKGRQDQQNCIRRGGRMRETHVLAVERRYGVCLRLCGHRRSTAGPGPIRSLPNGRLGTARFWAESAYTVAPGLACACARVAWSCLTSDSIPLTTMSQTAPIASSSSSSSNFQSVFNVALEAYEKTTKNKLLAHPLATQLQSCDSPTAILTVLRDIA